MVVVIAKNEQTRSCGTGAGEACFQGTFVAPRIVSLPDGSPMKMPVSAITLNAEIKAAGGLKAYQAKLAAEIVRR